MEMPDDLNEDELQTYEDLYKNLGARIQFQCDRVTYQGIIEVILPNTRYVKLRHSRIIEEDKYLGNLRFRFSEIAPFTVVESAENLNRFPKNEYLLNILKNKKLDQRSVTKVLFGELSSDESDNENTNEEDDDDKHEFPVDAPQYLENRLPHIAKIIDSVDEDFYIAVSQIADQTVIGLSFEGPEVFRFGKLTWICISTLECVFLFDIQRLKMEAFNEGLRNIFEDPRIKKVIHDCRFPSDCLNLQYSTKLNNIFDTRVADFIANFQRFNDKYDYTIFNTLDSCLRHYLKVPQTFLFKKGPCLSQADKESLFCKRPISKGLVYDFIKNVIYLILLYEKLRKELLGPFHRAVNSCLTLVSKAPTSFIDFIGDELSPPDSIPPTLLIEGIQTVRYQNPEKMVPISLECRFTDPITGNFIDPKTYKQSQIVNEAFDERKSSENLNKNERSVSNLSSSSKKPITDTEVEALSVRLSFRHIDEVYHKLVNKVHSDQSKSVSNIKPSHFYTSKFSAKKPTADCAFNSHPFENITAHDIYSGIKGNSVKDSKQDCSKIWAKLCAQTAAENDCPSLECDKRNIKFLPG